VAEVFEIGDEVDVRFDRAIVTGVHLRAGRCALTVLTADVEFTADVGAADTFIEKTGAWHDLRRCPQCSHTLKDCAHSGQYGPAEGRPCAQGIIRR
jgi:predicted RNA-binding protein with PIN domain